ncbi:MULTISPECIES: acyl-CoA dehydrogenase family protein [unclassified Mycobacterium]|uniref:acyl-CoA dehydrogenase family protein n=1 Tax=unclassified Mycobacterium TaxID=2642494 RepID=UPI0029C6FBF8|nr:MULTISPECIES: acyl-CoA dehydrogenase family protein [unclassified Mycobacterium]
MTIADVGMLDDLRDATRGFLAKHGDEQAVRAGFQGPTDRSLWTAMTSNLGVQSIGIPERFGGDGGGLPELRVVLEETGRALAPAPFLSTAVLVPSALLASGDDAACADYLPSLAAGTSTATLAAVETAGSWDATGWATVAEPGRDGWRLSGRKAFVLDGSDADLVLVFARTSQGLSLFAVEPAAEGVVRTTMDSLDLSRPLAQITFADTPARLIGEDGAADVILARLLDTARIALAAEALGGADHCLQLSVDYARTRVQFGRPIGSFQAIKHQCADMFLELEAARAALTAAASASTHRPLDVPLLAAVAFASSARAYFQIADSTIHVHGGIGFTWEHPAHLYYRRAKSIELFLGGPIFDAEAVLAALGV